MRRRLMPIAALVIAASPVGLWPSAAGAGPLCFGRPATHVMHVGDARYLGTTGNDVVVGSKGHDDINLAFSGGGGIDFACGMGGDDGIDVTGPGSKADGGAGNDRILASGGGALAQGGSGRDFLGAYSLGSRAEGGSGDDDVWAVDGATADGGSGNDLVTGSNAAGLFGGSGSDEIINSAGNPLIDCGAAYDSVSRNEATDVRRCEETFTN